MQAPGAYNNPVAPPPPAAPKKYDGQNGMPLYDASHGGHYGASAAIATAGHAPPPETFSGHWGNVSQGLNQAHYRDILNTYWQQVVTMLETENHDYKIHQLPLARIKKVMKADPEVKMISAEAPIIFAKACETFITELTMRAWIHAEENKRRTLQRSDIAAALGKSDMFDFLIDIVPREDAQPQHKRRPEYAVPEPGAQEQPGHAPQQAPPHQPQHEFLSAQPDQQQQQQQQQVQQAYYPQGGVFDPNIYQQVYTGAPPEQQGQYGSG